MMSVNARTNGLGKMVLQEQVSRQNQLLSSLKACSKTNNLERGQQLHAEAIECGRDSNIYIVNALINMYAKCGSMKDAHEVFDSIKHQTVVSWTALILGYADNGQGLTALSLFTRMRTEGPSPDSVTLVAALKSCTSLALKEGARQWSDTGKQLHNMVVEGDYNSDVYVGNVLIDMYTKCENMVDAHEVFEAMHRPDVVSWTALILGYAESGESGTALNLFVSMRTEGPALDAVTLVAAFKACTTLSNKGGVSQCSDWGKEIHSVAVENGYNLDVYVLNSLIDLHAKCGNIVDAVDVFDSMKKPNVVSWTALILGYADNGQGLTALDMFSRMRTENIAPNFVTLAAALKACTTLEVVECRARGKIIHNIAVENGCISEIYVDNSLIDMYAKCGSMVDARVVFEGMRKPTVVSWNVLILGYADNGQGDLALDMFTRMRIQCNSATLVAALKACMSAFESETNCRDWVRIIHCISGEIGCNSDVHMQSTLVDVYAKCGSMVEAHEVFNDMMFPDVVAWNVLILGYADNDQGYNALDMFSRMRKRVAPDSVTFVGALKACTSLMINCRTNGKWIHNIAVENGCSSDVYVQTFLVEMYGKCGSIIDARELFDSMKHRTVVSWNVLILGYAEIGEGHTALDLFKRMRIECPASNSVTLVACIKACTSIALKGTSSWGECRTRGENIHNIIVENGCNIDFYVLNSLIDMYTKCGSMVNAREVFDGMKQPTVVSWNVLILGYAENVQGHTSLQLFTRMRHEGPAFNSLTMVAALKACTSLAVKGGSKQWAKCSETGKVIYNLAVETGCNSDLFVQNSLIDMYAKCGSIVDACGVFDSMKHPDVVSWTALILGYADTGQGRAALDLFSRMRNEGPDPDSVTFGAALKACGLVGALEFGRAIHLELDNGNSLDALSVNCLVDFYAKFGCMLEAQSVLDLYPEKRDMVTWNTLLAGFSSSGSNVAVFKLFRKMQDAGFKPDEVTFLSVLTCCSHAGLVVKGREYFDMMSTKYGVSPNVKHYNCLIDLLGRANKLDDAVALLQHMPCSPNEVTWTAILGACCKWKNVEIGRLAFQSLINVNYRNLSIRTGWNAEGTVHNLRS